MHRLIQDHLEEVLAETALPAGHPALAHLRGCVECRDIVEGMRAQNELLREWSMPADSVVEIEVEPRPGFYARVLEQIAVQRPVSIWALFTESVMGRRLATASLAGALALGLFVVRSEQTFSEEARATEQLDPLYPAAGFPTDLMAANNTSGAVFMNLVSYEAH
jgi:hypothetical protein